MPRDLVVGQERAEERIARQRHQILPVEPARFGGWNGFHYEYTLKRKGDSLLFNGVGWGAVANGKLYLMSYSAPRTYGLSVGFDF